MFRNVPSPAQSPPLAGVTILAVEQFGAGPLGTMFLADLGAHVIKIEDPGVGGDVSRYIPPGPPGSDSLFFESFNRGKRSLMLDLKHEQGRAVLERLVRSADGIFSNLRGDQAAELGLTYASLGLINPAIVCVALTGYGRSSQDAQRPGYDALVQAESGWASLTGPPDGQPMKSGLSLADYVAGLAAALGLVVAMFDARATGQGRDVDVNLYDSALAMLTYPATWYLSAGIMPHRQASSAHPSIVPFQFFETADGYIAIACPKEKFFRALTVAMDLRGLADDSRFSNFEKRNSNRIELVGLLAARFAQLTTAEWLNLLENTVPAAPVRSMTDALELDDLRKRGMLAEYLHPRLGRVRSIGTPLKLGRFAPDYRPGPGLGEDSEAVLAACGFDAEEINALREAGVIGTHRSDIP